MKKSKNLETLYFIGGLFPREREDEIRRLTKSGLQSAANNLQWKFVKGVAVQHGYTVLGARLDLCNEDLLGVDDAAAVFDVLDALGILAEGRVPTLEDIMKSYLESCVDVPAGGWGTFAER